MVFIMKCRICGFEFDETKLKNRGCTGCGKHGCCNQVHCPNCGFGNHPNLMKNLDLSTKLRMELN